MGMLSEERAVGAGYGGGGGGGEAGVVYGGEVDGVFGGAAGDGVFVEGWDRGGFQKVGVEDDVGSMAGGPADGFGIAPAFVADGDSEGEGSGLEDLAGGAGGVDSFLRGVDLHFVLVAGGGAVGVDEEGSGAEGSVDDAFGS